MYIPGNLDWGKLVRTDPLLSRPLISGSYLSLVLIALLTPKDVLTNSAFLASFAQAVASLVPSINEWAAVSNYPEVTRLFFAVSWVVAPAQGLLAYWLPAVHRQMLTHWRGSLGVRLALPLLTIVMLPIFIWAAVTTGWETQQCVGVCLGRSRAALGFVGAFIPMASGFGCAVIAIWIRHFRDIYFPRQD
jgi:hypothetical protein